MALDTGYKTVTKPDFHFVYLEKHGLFAETAHSAWMSFFPLFFQKFTKEHVTGMHGLSKIDPSLAGPGGTIQCGVSVAAAPKELPPGLQYRKVPASKFASFVLTGPYEQLAIAYPKAIETVKSAKLSLRDGFFMETYLNTPDSVPPEKLQTEILVPLA